MKRIARNGSRTTRTSQFETGHPVSATEQKRQRPRTVRSHLQWATLLFLAFLGLQTVGYGCVGGHPTCHAEYEVQLTAVYMQCDETGYQILTFDELVTATYRITDVSSGEIVEEATFEYDSLDGFTVRPLRRRPKHVFVRICRSNGDCVEAEAVVFETRSSRSSCGTRVDEEVLVREQHGGTIGFRDHDAGGAFALPNDPEVCAELIADMEASTTEQ